MTFEHIRSFDFNQMLVTSVFLHLLFITVVMFLPKPTLEQEIIVPAFMVELVEIPSGRKSVTRKLAPVVEKPLAMKPEITVPPVPPEAIIPPVEPGKSQEILRELNQMSMIDELDQLAKMVPEPPPPAPVPEKTQPILDQTFKDREAIKPKEALPQKKELAVPVVEDPLKQFEKFKMQEDLESKPIVVKPEKVDDSLDDVEFAALTRESMKLEKKSNRKSAADLLRELTQMQDLKSVLASRAREKKPPSLNIKKFREKSKSLGPIAKKLASLNLKPLEVSIDFENSQAFAKDFESKIWKVEVPQVTSPDEEESESYVFSENEGPPGADALSLYISLIREKVYKKWYEPLAEKHNKETLISFFLFAKGNIDKPVLKKSSGVEQLDTLAIRAILDSEPFPEFPKELKLSNLNVTIKFKYVPEKN